MGPCVFPKGRRRNYIERRSFYQSDDVTFALPCAFGRVAYQLKHIKMYRMGQGDAVGRLPGGLYENFLPVAGGDGFESR